MNKEITKKKKIKSNSGGIVLMWLLEEEVLSKQYSQKNDNGKNLNFSNTNCGANINAIFKPQNLSTQSPQEKQMPSQQEILKKI